MPQASATQQGREVCIAPIPRVARTRLKSDDRHVPGIYKVITLASANDMMSASAALDKFHSTVPVRCLDDFQFVVFDPYSRQVLQPDPDAQGYANENLAGDVERIGDRLPRIYRVAVKVRCVDGDVTDLGEVDVAWVNQRTVHTVALRLLRDSRFDPARCSPQFSTKRIA